MEEILDSKQTDIEKYLLLVKEFKERLISADCFCKKLYISPLTEKNPKTIIDLENICLQLRKLLELIAMGSLVINQHLFEKTIEKTSKMWKAKYILREIKRLNPEYFPKPISDKFFGPDNNGYYTIKHVQKDILTEKLFEKIYDKCGAILHTPNPLGGKM